MKVSMTHNFNVPPKEPRFNPSGYDPRVARQSRTKMEPVKMAFYLWLALACLIGFVSGIAVLWFGIPKSGIYDQPGPLSRPVKWR